MTLFSLPHASATPSNAQIFAPCPTICCAFKKYEQDKISVIVERAKKDKIKIASLVPPSSPLLPSYLLFVLLFAAHSTSMSKTRCVLLNNEHVMLKRQAAQLMISDAASLPYHATREPHPLTPSYLLLVLLYPAICCAFIERRSNRLGLG